MAALAFLRRSITRAPALPWRALHHHVDRLLVVHPKRHIHILGAITRSGVRFSKPWYGSSSRRSYGSGDGGVSGGLCEIRNGGLRGFRERVECAAKSGQSRRILSRGTASAALAWGGKRVANGGLQGRIREPRLAVVASLKCYLELSKVRLSMLVLTTAGFGFVMGSGEMVDWLGFAWTSAGTMMTVCSANAFNQIMEIANDARMKRTMRRPLPSGRMSGLHAMAFAVTMGVGGVAILAYKTNALAAELGAGNLLLYTLVYTPLKQIHWINTWIGAVVGAIPPLMGWAAATGQIDAGGWIAGALLYFWQIPHFMALAFLCRQDYAAGRYKMLSLGDFSGRRTATAALRNCVYLIPLGFLAQDYNVVSGHFGMEMLLLSAGFGATATSFYFSRTSVTARKMFRASLLYLSVYMAAMIHQRIPNPNLRSHESSPSRNSEIEETREYEKQLVFTDLQAIEKDMKKPWPFLPPIASLSAAPFPFLPAPEDRTFQKP